METYGPYHVIKEAEADIMNYRQFEYMSTVCCSE